jgi:hypothetical protein
MIHKNILEKIKEQAKINCFDLVERLLDQCHERLIHMALNEEEKIEISKWYIGLDLFIVEIVSPEMETVELQYLDYIEAFAIYHIELSAFGNKDNISLYQATIIGGNSFFGWQYINKILLDVNKGSQQTQIFIEGQEPHEAPKG